MWPWQKKIITLDKLDDPIVEKLIQKVEQTKEFVREEGPPCPLEVALQGVCICHRCKHINKCPMELACRNDECKAVIGGCTIYDAEGDKNAENKRRIFKDRAIFEPNVFRFNGKKP